MTGNKKAIIIIVLIFVVILGPVFLLSNIGMGIVQRMVDKNPQGSAAPWFQYTLGKTFYYTLRPEKAAEAFKFYIDRYEENQDRRYWDAMYYRAHSLDDAHKSRQAAELFEYYYYNCPEGDPNRSEARKECLRLRRFIPTFVP